MPDLSAVIAAYLDAVDQGQRPDPDELLRRHPELADELREFLAAQAELERLGQPFRDVAVPEAVRRVGDYEVLAELGHGGMGVVYLARQVGLRRLVALKLIRAGRLARPDEVARFRREAEAVANLDHPGIVPIHEVGVHDGQYYLAMKWIECGDLRAHLARLRGDHPAVARLVAAVARAVHHAHQRGILHRDLKPGNILLDGDGQPHVTDFGLAKLLPIHADAAGESLTATGAVVGTPAYMAPEQARGRKDVSTAADVYGLGAILYLLLAGRPPFAGDDPLDVLRQVVETDPPTPRAIDPAVPRDLETICLKCLHKDPARRYDSAAALANDLERWLSGKPIAARPAGRLERLAKWSRRHPVATALLLASVVVFAGVARLVVQLWQALDAKEVAIRARDEADRQRRQAQEEALVELRQRNHLLELRAYAARLSNLELLRQTGKWSPLFNRGDAADEKLRGWEYAYLYTQFRHQGRVSLGNPDPWSGLQGASCATFSTDGKRIAAGYHDGRIKVWDAATGELLVTRWMLDPVIVVSFTPDGTRLMTGDERGDYSTTFTIWDTSTWKVLVDSDRADFPLLWREPLPGTDLTVFGYDVKVWAASPDGRRIAAGVACTTNPDFPRFDKGVVQVWDGTGRKVVAFGSGDHHVNRLVFSPDGRRIVVCCSGDEDSPLPIKVWDTQTGRMVLTLEGPLWDPIVAYSPDGLTIAGAARGQFRVWDARTGAVIRTWEGPEVPSTRLAFSPDGLRLAEASGPHPNSVDDLRPGTVRVWDTRSGAILLTLIGHNQRSMWSVAFSPDGQRLVTADGTLTVWNARTGRAVPVIPFSGDVRAISSDGNRLAFASGDRTVKVWDVRARAFVLTTHLDASDLPVCPGEEQLTKVRWHRAGGGTTVFTPDGRRRVAWGPNVWDAKTGELLLSSQEPKPRFGWVAFSPDGTRLFASDGKKIEIHDGRFRPEDVRLLKATREMESAGFSQDGRYVIAKALLYQGYHEAWNLQTGDRYATAKNGQGMDQTWTTLSGGWADDPPPPPTAPLKPIHAGQRLRVLGDEILVVPEKSTHPPLAEQLAELASVPQWHEEHAAKCEQAGEWFAAEFHLGRLLADAPWDATLHVRRADALARLGRHDDALRHALHALFLNPRIALPGPR